MARTGLRHGVAANTELNCHSNHRIALALTFPDLSPGKTAKPTAPPSWTQRGGKFNAATGGAPDGKPRSNELMVGTRVWIADWKLY